VSFCVVRVNCCVVFCWYSVLIVVIRLSVVMLKLVVCLHFYC
jgi:hypothetical protein